VKDVLLTIYTYQAAAVAKHSVVVEAVVVEEEEAALVGGGVDERFSVSVPIRSIHAFVYLHPTHPQDHQRLATKTMSKASALLGFPRD
jgi:hypothetical protein